MKALTLDALACVHVDHTGTGPRETRHTPVHSTFIFSTSSILVADKADVRLLLLCATFDERTGHMLIICLVTCISCDMSHAYRVTCHMHIT